MKYGFLFSALLVSGCTTTDTTDVSTAENALGGATLPNNLPIPDALGVVTTFSTNGSVDLRNEFFQQFGTNGRSCGSCHTPFEGWSVSADELQMRFAITKGMDPIFRPVDGATNPDADVSTYDARRNAYSMLLNRGTIRVGIGVPAGAEFELVAVDDPYGHASASELSLFRRPLPAANLTFFQTVMWDGRVTGATLDAALSAQADGATLGHAQALAPLPPAANQSVVDFESNLFNGQLVTWRAGRTDDAGALGGAENLAGQTLVADRFDLFDSWANSPIPERAAAYRGQELFNTRRRTNGAGACNGCHSAQNAGTSVKGSFFNLGTSSAANRTADLPLYTFRNLTTGETVQTTDPGRALITGLWKDMSKFKVPALRGLGARAPYFHNGSARTLLDVVKFYEANVSFSFTPDEESDLVAFLSAL